MKALRIILLVLLATVVVGGVYYAISAGRRQAQIVIGGKNFTEQSIVGEMAAQLIEAHTGLTVQRKFNLASNLPIKLIQTGEIDLFLDYTGTGYVDILQKPYQGQTAEEIYQYVHKVYPEKFALQWLAPLGFKNTYTLTMRSAQAKELGIEKISDLSEHTDLRAGFDPAFIDRQDGYPGLRKQYGFAFDEDPLQLSIGMMYTNCRNKTVDVIDAFSTDGRIERFDLKVLQDDKHFFPPYDAAFVIRSDVLEKYPEVGEALGKLAGMLDDRTMGRLNYTVDQEDRTEQEVAREFLASKGLLERE